MKIVKKVLILLMGIIIIACIKIPNTYASNILFDKTNLAQISITDISGKAENFIGHGRDHQISGLKEDEIAIDFIPLGQILVIVANAVLVIVAVIMGIKWITANPEQQGKLKQQLIGLVVATAVIYGAVGIWTIVKDIMQG